MRDNGEERRHHERQEIVVSEDDVTEIVFSSEEKESARVIARARADVIRACGYTVASMVPLITLLSFLDSLLNHTPWSLDVRILLAVLGSVGAITAFAWKTKEDK